MSQSPSIPRAPENPTAATVGPVDFLQAPFRLEPPPARIGPYRIVSEIGKGGMGAVYLAMRDDEGFARKVAIKVIKRGMDAEHILRRFELERQVLASLNHPNIGRLFDGGATEDGRPYFVMEYIEGLPIDQYCDTRRLRVDERLELFRHVCAAVQYAHQNLIVHRDIKPGNILVTNDGVPKLVDFGIAKLLGPTVSTSRHAPTAPEMRLMTPEYASPEQVRGESVTTSTDVYSLGVLLYELLTGHRPYQLKSRLQAEIERVICNEEPDKPSTAVSRVEEISIPASGEDLDPESGTGSGTRTITPESVSKTRGGRPERLRRRLAGDIDNIVLMAMRKEPQRRYLSAEQFGEDIRRHLGSLPVIARSDTLSYRLAKFVSRNKAGVAAAAAIALSLLGGIVATAWQAREAAQQRDEARVQRDKADRRFDQVRSLAHIFMFDFHDAIEKLAGSVPARELLVKNALAYLENLKKESGGRPDIQREIAAAYQRVGDIQGGVRSGNLGATADALNSYKTAHSIFSSLSAASPADAGIKQEVATSALRTADLLAKSGDMQGAIARLNEARAIHEAALAKDPASTEARRSLAIVLRELADALDRSGDTAGALAHLQKSLALREALAAEATDPARRIIARRDLSGARVSMADLLDKTGDGAGALLQYREALAIRKELADAEPDSARAQRDLFVVHYFMSGILLKRGDLTAALESVEAQRAIAQKLADADPANTRARRDLIIAYERLGDVQKSLDNQQAALDAYTKLQELALAARAADPANAEFARIVAGSHSRLGDVYLARNDFPRAVSAFRESLALAAAAKDASPNDALARRNLAIAEERLGRALVASGDAAGASESFSRASAIFSALASDDPSNVSARADLARLSRRTAAANALAGDHAAAVRELDSAVAAYRDLVRRDPGAISLRIDLCESLAELSDAAAAAGDKTRAAAVLKEALDALPSPEPGSAAARLRESLQSKLDALQPGRP